MLYHVTSHFFYLASNSSFYLSQHRKLFVLLVTLAILSTNHSATDLCRNNCNVNGHAVLGQCNPVCRGICTRKNTGVTGRGVIWNGCVLLRCEYNQFHQCPIRAEETTIREMSEYGLVTLVCECN